MAKETRATNLLEIKWNEADSEIVKLFHAKRYKELEPLLNRRIAQDPDSKMSMSFRIYRAFINELGGFGETDLESAFKDYEVIYEQSDSVIGALGLARVLQKVEGADLMDIVNLYEYVLQTGRRTWEAAMNLGRIKETIMHDDNEASSLYLRAFRHGQPWGLRYYARLHWRNGNFLRSIAGHLVSAALLPMFAFSFRGRQPFGC